MKARLLLWPECDRDCPKCANKGYDLHSLLTVRAEDLGGYEEIILTGGEPMLFPQAVLNIIRDIRLWRAPIYMYTAKIAPIETLLKVLDKLDGVTITLYNARDRKDFLELDATMPGRMYRKSLRLNVFGPDLPERYILWAPWKITKKHWLDKCPLPEGEVFMKYGGKIDG